MFVTVYSLQVELVLSIEGKAKPVPCFFMHVECTGKCVVFLVFYLQIFSDHILTS